MNGKEKLIDRDSQEVQDKLAKISALIAETIQKCIATVNHPGAVMILNGINNVSNSEITQETPIVLHKDADALGKLTQDGKLTEKEAFKLMSLAGFINQYKQIDFSKFDKNKDKDVHVVTEIFLTLKRMTEGQRIHIEAYDELMLEIGSLMTQLRRVYNLDNLGDPLKGDAEFASV